MGKTGAAARRTAARRGDDAQENDVTGMPVGWMDVLNRGYWRVVPYRTVGYCNSEHCLYVQS
jgi:hypothetical protein